MDDGSYDDLETGQKPRFPYILIHSDIKPLNSKCLSSSQPVLRDVTACCLFASKYVSIEAKDFPGIVYYLLFGPSSGLNPADTVLS